MQYKIFGCKVNKYYTDKWLNSNYLSDKKGIFIASCVVTDSAKRKWIKFVKDTAKEIQGEEKIFISGCGAFKEGRAQNDFFELYPELAPYTSIIEVLGEDPEEGCPHPELLPKGEGKKEVTSSTSLPLGETEGGQKIKSLSSKLQGIYTKKFVLIQGGCDSFCTFCLTVKKRGRHYFRAKEDILEEICDFEKQGGKEVVLTGVNLSAWGLDTTIPSSHSQVPSPPSPLSLEGEGGKVKSRFSELLRYLLDHTTIPRIRISSLGPEFIDDACLEIFKETRIYPHFHYSVQSGSSAVLKSMARHYDGPYIKELLEKTKALKRADGIDVSLGADIIVGFPGESDTDFLDTYTLVKEVGIQKLHAFPFSAHEMGESVPAGSFPNQVDEKVKKTRLKTLLDLGDEIRTAFIESQQGKEFEVLIESVKATHPSMSTSLLNKEQEIQWKGWTQNYIEAHHENFQIMSGEVKRNEIVRGRLNSNFM